MAELLDHHLGKVIITQSIKHKVALNKILLAQALLAC
jgi:hypothetical protein